MNNADDNSKKSFQIQPRECVLLAENFSLLVDWYRDVLGFEVKRMFDAEYKFCNLETVSGIKLGIGCAKQMGVSPTDRSQNTFVFQFGVENLKEFFQHVAKYHGVVTFGPSYDEKDKFWFGGISDPEGNPIWVVDNNCP